MDTVAYACDKCGFNGNGAPVACEACGNPSIVVTVRVDFSAPVSADFDVAKIRAGPKQKSGHGRKPRWQREIIRKKGRWHQTDRETVQHNDTDRIAKTIREIVTDRRTGEVLIDKTEPLPDHKDRGSAKPRS